MPLISIIIPLFNKEQFIQKTLNSVLNQTFNDFEIIIVNDGSTDKSEEVVLDFTDDRIKYFSKKKEGASSARNYGIEKSSGEFMAFLDADDIWFPKHLQTLKKLIESFPQAGIYASRYTSKVSEKKYIKNSFLGISETFSGIVPDFFHSSLVNRIALTSAVVVPKNIFRTVGLFNPFISSGQDLDLWIRIAIHFPVAIGDTITVEYNAIDKNSLSKTNIQDKKLINFADFKREENTNKSLKAFLDINRMDYALKFKISGDYKTAYRYYNEISKENITLKNWLVFHLPRFIQIPLLKIKKNLYKKGFEFSVYR